MRLVLDTNTALSGLLWGGLPGRLIDAAVVGRVDLFSSVALLAEFEDVLVRTKFVKQLNKRGLDVRELLDGYAALVQVVAPARIEPTVIRDPADDQVLAAALAAQVELIVSGDVHLLELKVFRTIEIVTAAVACQRCLQV